jgi:hypothetical protein
MAEKTYETQPLREEELEDRPLRAIPSSGNVFADLGLDNPEERLRLAKERMAREIADGTLKPVP